MAITFPWSWPSCSWRAALFLLLLFLLFPTFSMQQFDDGLYLNCLRNSTTSLSTTFTRNLTTALRNFTTLSSQGSKYASISMAGSSSQVSLYAVFQCRGDLSTQSCGECVQNATARLPKECPESVGARIRLEGCFLRYDNQSFFTLDTTSVLVLCNTMSTSNNVTLETIASLMEKVTSEAPEQGGFASATARDMYAVAQCLRYLSPTDCSRCLSIYTYRSCDSKLGMQAHLASCDFRYEAYNFLDTAPPPAASPPSPAPTPAPPRGSAVGSLPPSPSPPPAAGSKTIIIVVSVVVGVIVVLCAILVWRYKASKIKGKIQYFWLVMLSVRVRSCS